MNPLSDPSYLLPPLFIVLAYCVLLVLIWRGARHDLKGRLLGGVVLSIAVSSLLIFGMRLSPDIQHALRWERAAVVIYCSTFVLYYHFTLVYTGNKGQRAFLITAYLFLLVYTVLAPSNQVIAEMRLESYGYAPTLGILGLIGAGITVLLMLGGAYNLFRRYSASQSYEEKNRLLYVIIALSFPILGGMFDAFSNLPPVVIWANLLFAVTFTIAILKYHLLDIRIAVRKGLVFLIMSTVVGIPYVGLLYSFHYIFEATLEPWWTHVLVVLLLAILLRPLYGRAQELVDKLFYRDRYDYLKALEEFSRKAQAITSISEISSRMAELVKGALRPSKVALLLWSDNKHGFIMVSSTGYSSPPSEIVFRGNSPIVNWLSYNRDFLSSEQFNISTTLQSLSFREINMLRLLEAKLYMPIVSRQGKLSGILVLGENLSHQPYSGEDMQLLTALGNQMAIILDNARLYTEVRDSEEKLRLTFESITEGIIVFNMDGNIVDVNKATLQLHGYSDKEELIGRNTVDFIDDKDRTKTMESLKRSLRYGPVNNAKFTLLRKDGSAYPAEVSLSTIKDESGKTTGFVAIIENVTERNQAEEREIHLQQQLYHSSRLASIGELAAGVAHEINNPLTGIMGFSQRLARKSTDETSKRDLERIYEEACRAAKVVENLRNFARPKEPKRELISVDDVVQKALEMRNYELRTSNIEVIADISPGLPQISADSYQILQVFLNIIINAEQAIGETNHGGKLGIKIDKHEGYIRISFTNDGPGIPSHEIDKLFDTFFTTRGEQGGTGLGLSICNRIVTEHSGKIHATSKPGQETTFVVELPLPTSKDTPEL